MLGLLSTMMVPTLPMAPALPVLLLVLLLGAQPQGAVAGWKRQPCAAAVPGNEADIVTRWGATVDPTQAAPLPEHPRPQLVRADEASWANLNGIWEWQSATGVNGTVSTPPPFGRTLARSILVPFPAESCLSGIRENHAYQWYRLSFSGAKFAGGRSRLHFGAVDWQSKVYLNKQLLGEHTGGYDGFSFDTSAAVTSGKNELLVFVYDPSELGAQPFGKQRAASIKSPGTDGEKYTPTSGIWQTVWMEKLPEHYIAELSIETNLTAVTVHAMVAGGAAISAAAAAAAAAAAGFTVKVAVEAAPGETVAVGTAPVAVTAAEAEVAASANADGTATVSLAIPDPQLWSPGSPFLYNLTVTLLQAATDTGSDSHDGVGSLSAAAVDEVKSYCGMRTVSLGEATGGGRKSLFLNGKPFFASGWLDQSWWPDGQYTAPTDEALAFDVQALATFGMNMVRLHQKINPDRWYYHADRAGVVVMQDAVQHFNYHVDESGESQNLPINTTLFASDWSAAIRGRYNHPCIIQWDIFNEFEYEQPHWGCTNTSCDILAATRALDSTRLVDFNSGGPGNALGIGDVNDIHSYPNPSTERGAATVSQYGMVGEYGGIGWAAPGHEWLPGMCQRRSAGNYNTSAGGAAVLLKELGMIADGKAAGNISAVVYTQITDVELECDGIFTYDRVSHYNEEDTARIKAANLELTRASGQ